ncbi:5'-nucleotidase SurE [Alphaproteobacteria bacterium SO-S41]|nr:5'-nucleotidase SurE [Alphaproteobacteria bacterium SO-S41]
MATKSAKPAKTKKTKPTAVHDKDGWRPLRILVSNDDGIHAPGLKAAEKIAKALSDDVWVIAPETEQSGASHSLTLSRPLRVRAISKKRFAVDGTPTDCVMMGMLHLMKDEPPDLVLSGVNRGSNIADDVTYSGTIAAAMEGTVLGVPSIALSQAFVYDEHVQVKWSCAEHHGPIVIRKLLAAGWPKDVLININFPDRLADKVEGVRVTSQGKRDQANLKVDQRIDARGNPYFWFGFQRILSNPPAGTDLRAIYDGFVSVTPLHLNLTEAATIPALEKVIGKPPKKPRKAKPTPRDVEIG